MCGNCEREGIGRRKVLQGGAALLVSIVPGVVVRTRRSRCPDHAHPDEALDALKSGNERYVKHPELCTIDLATQRSAAAAHQAP